MTQKTQTPDLTITPPNPPGTPKKHWVPSGPAEIMACPKDLLLGELKGWRDASA